jgi:hypothetical protein
MPGLIHNMDSPQMHFAVGMLCAGLIWLLVLLVRPAWWLYMPLVMTGGGLWAEGPDLPLLFHYYPSLRVAGWIRGNGWSESLHAWWPNLFFFHGWIDQSGDGGAVRGWVIALVLYVVWIAILLVYAHWLRGQAA